MNNLGLAFGMIGAWDRALAIARRALPLDPAQDHVVRTNLGNYYRIMGLYDRARAEVDRSYDSAPDYWVPPYARAWIEVVEGRPEAAVDPLLDLAAAQPHPRILAGIAWVLMLAGADSEAAALIEQVMGEAPDLPGRFKPDPPVLPRRTRALLHHLGQRAQLHDLERPLPRGEMNHYLVPRLAPQ
jgi:tetratricopeptide (TPR) repeat protein